MELVERQEASESVGMLGGFICGSGIWENSAKALTSYVYFLIRISVKAPGIPYDYCLK